MDNISSDKYAGVEGGFHQIFDENVRELMEPVRETLIESVESCTSEEIIGQLLMNLLGDYEDPDKVIAGSLSVDQKARLVRIASHMGPDWAQALYHAAVFITKVA